MNRWPVVKLGDVTTKVGSGATPKGGEQAYKHSGIPLIRSMNIHFDGFKRDGLAYLDTEQAASLDGAEVRAGDVLLNITGASIGRVTQAPTEMDGARVNQHVCIIRTTSDLDAEFLAAYLRTPDMQKTIIDEESGATRQALTKAKILAFNIPLPPIKEQRHIVSKLKSLRVRSLRIKEALGSIPDLLEKLRQSVLATAFRGGLTADWRSRHPNVEPASKLLERIHAERRRRWEEAELENFQAKGKQPKDDSWKAKYHEPGPIDTSGLPDLPPNWCWTSLGSLLQLIEAGHSPKALGRPAMPHESGVLKVSAVSWGEFLPEENKALPPGQQLDASVTVRANDLLISRANTPELVGAVVIARESHPNLMLSDKTLRLVPLDTGISKEYLLYSLRTHWVRALFAADATGTSDSMRNLSQDKIRSAPIALAPIEEQQEIARRLSIITATHDSLSNHHKSTKDKINELEQSFLSKAFRGELIPQEPTDEPTSILLDRIRQTQAQESARLTIRRIQSRPKKPSTPLLPVPNRNDIPQNHLKLIVERNGGRMSAFDLYKSSGLTIDDFYAQLRIECGNQKPLRDISNPPGSRDVYIEVSR